MQPLERPKIGRLASPALREMADSIPEIDHYELIVDLPAGRYVNIPWTDCVAIIRDENTRSVLSRDGSTMVVEPDSWKSGYTAISLIDRYAPPDVVVR